MVAAIDNSFANAFANFGEQLKAIVDAERGAPFGRSPDPRLLQIRAAAGASETVPSDGGFLVAPQFSREIVKRMYLTGEILKRCFVIPTLTDKFAFPQFAETSRVDGSRLGGIEVYSEPEAANLAQNPAGQSTATKPQFMLTELEPKKIMGLMYITNELALDSSALSSWATYAFSQELTFTLEKFIVNGTGAGQPLGINNAPALIVVPKETGQATATVVSNNAFNMASRLWAASRPNACWIYHQELLPSLATLSLVVGAAGSQSKMWHWQCAEDDYDRLCGIPAFPSEYCASPGAQGDIILADFSRYVVAMRDIMKADVSIHIRFLTDESAFRFVMRVDGEPIDPAPVTPRTGTKTTSPFVALAARP